MYPRKKKSKFTGLLGVEDYFGRYESNSFLHLVKSKETAQKASKEWPQLASRGPFKYCEIERFSIERRKTQNQIINLPLRLLVIT